MDPKEWNSEFLLPRPSASLLPEQLEAPQRVGMEARTTQKKSSTSITHCPHQVDSKSCFSAEGIHLSGPRPLGRRLPNGYNEKGMNS